MTLNELQILLALNGNSRIEYAENEIFASKELYTCYLESICSEYWWYGGYKKGNNSDLIWLAYYYARDVIKGRWLEAERVIATEPARVYSYAKFVIEGRFPEAEHVIASDRDYAFVYNIEYGTNI